MPPEARRASGAGAGATQSRRAAERQERHGRLRWGEIPSE
jgi:hypothetical protein